MRCMNKKREREGGKDPERIVKKKVGLSYKNFSMARVEKGGNRQTAALIKGLKVGL